MADERIDDHTGLYLSGGVAATDSADRQFRREAQSGRSAVRLRRGVFTTTEHWGQLTPRQRLARANRAISFGRTHADNPGESLSRVAIFELGFPDPLLQTCHRNPRGGFCYTDFEWPAYRAGRCCASS
jgi:hypothetical protein